MEMTTIQRAVGVLILVGLWIRGASILAAAEQAYFAIQVVDESTGRGVPLVELETIHKLRFVTDSQGLVAIAEPELFDQQVYFSVRSHGYEYPADGFGFRGKAFHVKRGGSETIAIKRINLAERLYRVTGGGIYRDSVLLGKQTPPVAPLLNAGVIGCDSVMAASFRDRIYWFWGDTSRLNHPLGGNFHITGATSRLPGAEGLEPGIGINFDYFVESDGRLRGMAPMAGAGPTWISALTVLREPEGRERLYAGYVKIRNQLESYQWGVVAWDDATQQFTRIASYDNKPPLFLEPQAHTFLQTEADGKEYVYFCNPLQFTRVPATPEAYCDFSRYEGFSCLKTGTGPEAKELDRDRAGRLQYAWKPGTPPLTQQQAKQFIAEGKLEPRERRIALRDVVTGRAVEAHSGSVYWNDYRKRWVLITVELFGESSGLGEVWFAEADEPTGPWVYARKIVTHDRYSFYNPKQHPFFDQEGGRVIFFEGTYTHTFSGNPEATPRYDYNQIMYRLDLSRAELALPVAFYEVNSSNQDVRFVVRAGGTEPTFFAMEQATPGTIPMVWQQSRLEAGMASEETVAAFYALPMDLQTSPETTTPLYEYGHQETGRYVYRTDADWQQVGYFRTPVAVCRVWKGLEYSGPPER